MPRRVRPGALGLALGSLLAVSGLVAPAEAVVVEKIVAVVGDHAILLTDLHARARPFLARLNARCPIGTPQCIPAENKIYQQLIEHMVDEELALQAAKRANIVVTSRDLDATIERVAQMNGVTKTQLIARVTRESGMTEADYRVELRQQIVEGKLLQRTVQSQIRITLQDLEEMYQRLVERERQILLYQPAWIVLPIAGGATAEARLKEAAELVRRARAGEDFGDLARANSGDSRTRDDGGSLGIRAPAGSPPAASGEYKVLAEPLEKVALTLPVGGVSEPLRYKDAVVVMRITNRQPSRYPSFEAAQNEVAQRVQAEKLEKAKQKWLKDLRRRTHVDVRFL